MGVKMKIIIGAGNTTYAGWLATQENELNILNRADFEKQFQEESIDAMLAEHVWEHMTEQEGIQAAKNCYTFLKRGGYIRCAVPDKNFRIHLSWYKATAPDIQHGYLFSGLGQGYILSS